MGAAEEGVLSAIGVDVFAAWVEFVDKVEFADKVEFEDNVEFGAVELEESKVGTAVTVAVELLFEDSLAVDRQQRMRFTSHWICRDFMNMVLLMEEEQHTLFVVVRHCHSR